MRYVPQPSGWGFEREGEAGMELKLERREQADLGRVGNTGLSMTPPVGEDYWSYRVGLTEAQAVVGFPKHGTIGIGFAVEEDWNTNLPYRVCSTAAIVDHIWHNRGDKRITREMVTTAVDMIREAAAADNGVVLDV